MLSVVLKLSAQNFPLQGNETWVYNRKETSVNPPGGCTIDTWRFYELQGDTLLDGTKWFKLFNASYIEIYCTFPSSHTESFIVPHPSGFLRDSADVWLYRLNGNTPPEVLFSFGLSVGQKFFPNESCLVDQISTTNTTPPRRIESQWSPSGNGLATKVIEGVGAVHSFFSPDCYSCFSSDCITAINLKCFKQNGVEVPLNLFQDCAKSEMIYQKILDYQQQTPTHEAEFGLPKNLYISPNPASDNVKLDISTAEMGGDFRVDVFDQTGNLVFSQRYASSPELDVATWKSGVYVVRVSGLRNGARAYGRFVKM